MQKLIVHGGKPLNGDIYIGGMKNAALPILYSTILTKGECTLHNIPNVSDVTATLDILTKMGAKVAHPSPHTIVIDTSNIQPCTAPFELVSKIRASSYLMGAELGRFHKTKVAYPGGCNFGQRPIDLHLKGFEAMGTTIRLEDGCVCGTAEDGLHGASIYLDFASVGATANILLASVLSEGVTTLDNAAREPHIVDLANFLNICGAHIVGAGTSVIRIHGVKELHGIDYTILPDMIEAGTYMIAAAATNGCVTIHNIIPKHLDAITAKLVEAGIVVTESSDSLTIHTHGPLHPIHVKALPYPGFPTDMHPQIAILMCLAQGVSSVTEGVWENRFRYVDELRRMGANINVNGRIATYIGQGYLVGAPVAAVDLRAGAAMVIAALAANGRTEIVDVEKIARGYDDITGVLKSLGADIELLDT